MLNIPSRIFATIIRLIPSPMYQQALIDAGFTRHQAAVYSYLVEHGPSQASAVARNTNISRTLTYRVLDELAALGLAEKEDKKGAVSVFTPAHPVKLHELVERRKKAADQAAAAVGSVVDSLTSEYNKTLGKPGVVFYEGLDGIARLYEDVNATRLDIKLIRSVYDNDHPELASLVDRQIATQVKLGIKTRAITPLVQETPETVIHHDAARLVTRCIVPPEALTLPSQVLIYGRKVALTSFKTSIFTTIIDNTDIRDTYNALFEYIWSVNASYHEKALAAIMRDDV